MGRVGVVDTLHSTTLELEATHLAALEAVSKPSLGFPHDFLHSDGVRDMVRGEIRKRIDGRP